MKKNVLCMKKKSVSRDGMLGAREDFPNGKKLVVFTDSVESFPCIASIKQTLPEPCRFAEKKDARMTRTIQSETGCQTKKTRCQSRAFQDFQDLLDSVIGCMFRLISVWHEEF